MKRPVDKFSFAHGEVVAPAGLWERGVEASDYIPPSTPLLEASIKNSLAGDTARRESSPPLSTNSNGARRAPKASATSPTGETGAETDSTPNELPRPKTLSADDDYGWNAPVHEITAREIDETFVGREVARDAWVDGQARARQLREQSEDFVRRLERINIHARTPRGETTIVGLVSGKAERATDYRNCNLIPAMQSKNVHDMLKSVRYMVHHTPDDQLRMLVISAGWCRYDQYREHHRAHTRRMSKFAAEPLLKDFGITVEFYNVENTIHREDVAMLNMHSHVLIRCTRRLGKKNWKKFLAFVRNYFPKGYVHDSKIGKPNEVVKYVFKPAEFELLTNDELFELWFQITGGRAKYDADTGEFETRVNADGETVLVYEGPLKFFHPYGEIKRMRRELRANGQKLIMVPTKHDAWVWRITEKRISEPAPDASNRPPDDLVLAKTRPMPKFSPRMEPCLVVQNYSGDFDRMIAVNGLHELRADAKALFEKRLRMDAQAQRRAEKSAAEGAPLSRTHTTTTVPEGDTTSSGSPPDSALHSLRPPGGMMLQ